ncbi:hypothetical protein [Fusibacter bizertensis]
MSECICSSCKNLKSVIDENDIEDNRIEEVCEFGFPADDCSSCELDGCELTCSHYVVDEADSIRVITKNCAICNTELEVVAGSVDEADVYCVSCYLTKH